MRILWVKAGKLLPVDTGGKIRSYNLLRHLVRQHEVVLLSYYGGPRDSAYESELRKLFPLAEPVANAIPDSPRGVGAAVDYARRILLSAPYAVTKFSSRRARSRIVPWLRDRRFDVAVCDFLSASRNFPETSETPAVLFQHNVESILWRRQSAHEPNPIVRTAFALEAWKMARYERATVRRFRHVIAVSDRDRDEMASMVERSRISVVPTGVETAEYGAAAGCRATAPIVMFLGSMDWEANVDAVDYFCREIWPAVRAAVPEARFRIVGRNPSPRVAALASSSVEVTGRVPSVIDYLKETAVFVVPLRIGGGTRLKIFEAMAAGRAIVSTSVGAEGLDVHDGADVMLADTPSRFADRVIELLRDPARRAALEAGAAATAARHDWSVAASCFEQTLQRAIDDHRRGLVEVAAAPAQVGA